MLSIVLKFRAMLLVCFSASIAFALTEVRSPSLCVVAVLSTVWIRRCCFTCSSSGREVKLVGLSVVGLRFVRCVHLLVVGLVPSLRTALA